MGLRSCEITIVDAEKGVVAETYHLATGKINEYYCRFWENGKNSSPLLFTGSEKPFKEEIFETYHSFKQKKIPDVPN